VNRTDRLTGIILALRGGRRTVQELADRFEVSRRTILRDIGALSEIGVPLITTAGTGGGVEIADGYWLAPLHLTAAEASALLLGLQAFGDAGAPLAPERISAEEKLRAILRPDIAGMVARELGAISISPPASAVERSIFATLRDAIHRGIWVTGTYQSERRVAVRVLWPVNLYFEEGRWYCTASVAGKGGQRRFRVDRFVDLRPSPAPIGDGEHPADEPVPTKPYDDPSYPELVIHLTYVGMRRAQDERGWADHVRDLGDGIWEVRFRCPPEEHPFYARLVYTLGPEAEAVSPPTFREMVRTLIQDALDRYSSKG
jgi:predicted DNA-binding transcriptional regulator YafY